MTSRCGSLTFDFAAITLIVGVDADLFWIVRLRHLAQLLIGGVAPEETTTAATLYEIVQPMNRSRTHPN